VTSPSPTPDPRTETTDGIDDDPSSESNGSKRRRPVFRFIVGFALLAAAVAWIVIGQRDAVGRAIEHAAASHWSLILLGLLLPLVNWSTVSASFQVLSGRVGRVGMGEMHALIASAWLLNYLPMRPGMAGRIAYHKLVNGITVRDAVGISILTMLLSAVATGVMILVAIVPTGFGGGDGGIAGERVVRGLLLASPVLIGAAWAVAAAAWGGAHAWRLPIGFVLRYGDMLAWGARYAVVFAAVGQPIGFELAAVLAGVSQAAYLLPIAGNGLGVREWSVGLIVGAAGRAELGGVGDAGADLIAIAIAADLVNRALELAVAVPLGTAATPMLAARARRRRAERPKKPAESRAQAPAPGSPEP